MAGFKVVGGSDPYLEINLKPNEKVYAKSNCMLTMDTCIGLTARMKGGFLNALGRSLFNEIPFFMEEFYANNVPGVVTLTAHHPGAIKIIKVSDSDPWNLTDGVYLASTERVELNCKMQSIGGAIFGNTGGFMITKTGNSGLVAVYGMGHINEIDITPDRPLIIASSHVVAWQSSLDYEITMTTNHGNIVSRVVNSVLTGQFIMTKFKGNGKVLVSSRSAKTFVGWLVTEGGLATHEEVKSANKLSVINE